MKFSFKQSYRTGIRAHHFLMICFIFLQSYSFSQSNNFQFSQLNVKDGLSHGLVNSICQDKEGFLWIGTFDGLNRFDGKNFKVFKYNRRNPHSLGNNIVHDVCVDQKDNIWCATEQGVSCYNKLTDSFENYILIDDSSHQAVTPGESTILCDRQGVVWVGTSACGLFEFIPGENKFKNYRRYTRDSTSLPSNRIRKHSMAEDKSKHGLWLCTYQGVCYFDTDKKIAYSCKNNPNKITAFDNHRVFPLCITNDNKLVYGDDTDYELCFYDITNNKLTRTKKIMQENRNNAPAEAANFFCDSKNNLWITTWAYHFWRIDGITGEIQELFNDEKNPRSINSTFCWDVFEDKEGTLWFGGTKGLSYFNDEKNFYSFYRPDLRFPLLQAHPFIYNFFEDENDIVWFGTQGAGLFSYDFKTDTYDNFSFEKNSANKTDYHNSITSLVEIKNELWLGTNSGMQIFNKRTKKFRKYNPAGNSSKLDSSFTLHLTKECDSILWFYDNLIGLSRLHLNNNSLEQWQEINADNKKVYTHYLFGLYLDSKKNIWIETDDDGILKYNSPTQKFHFYPSNSTDTNALPASPASNMVEDNSDYLWMLCLGQGITKFDPQTGIARTWNSSDGLAYDPARGISSDKFNRLWITGYNLLSVFDPKTNRFENYYIEFAENNYNYNNAMLTLHNGKIVSGMLGAFALFDPEKQIKKLPLKNILISNFKVFEKSIPFSPLSPEISLSYKENFFSLDYSVVTGIDYDKIEYSYKLEGFDKDWVIAGKRQTAAYTNVPGGDYTFKVRARRGNEQWTDPNILATIHVSKIFYETWWFRFLIALCMFLVIRFYVRFRERQHRDELEQEAIDYFTHSQYTNNNADEILWDLARNVISRLGFEDCVIYLLDKNKNTLIQKAALDNKMKEDYSISNPIEIPIGKGIVGTVAATGKAEIIGDTSKDERYIVDDKNRLSEISVPIIHKEKIIGVIDSESPKKYFFTNKHLQLLTTIASISSDKIANAIARQEIHEKEVKLLEYDKRVAEVRLTALRAQMNPHFIFNCLNAIDNYILKNDIEVASKYLNKFARLIRSILSVSDRNFVSLQMELDLLNNYIELENLRFEEKFLFVINVGHDIDSEEIEIPSMLIQPFVENAIVHGLAHKKGIKKLSITISLKNTDLLCAIEDNGIGRPEAQKIKNAKTQTHESKGMKVTEGRLELLQQQIKEKGLVNVFDLSDSNGVASGTRVEILIPIENY